MFGRQPRLPIDIAFGLPVTNKPPHSHSEYVKRLKRHLEELYQVAIKNSSKIAEKNQKKVSVIRESTLDVGDRVLDGNLRLRNKHKSLGFDKKMKELPVYSVKPEKGDGSLRTLHNDDEICFQFEPTQEVREAFHQHLCYINTNLRNKQRGNQEKNHG